MTTTIPSVKQMDRKWLLIDAKDQILGRLASRIALILRGKHKPTYTPFLDTGDFVVVVNADKVAVTGQKLTQKVYQRYSGYPGGRSSRLLGDVLSKHPDRVLRQAVKGMMPDGSLGRRLLGKLKIYAGPEHPHRAQQPQPVSDALLGKRSFDSAFGLAPRPASRERRGGQDRGERVQRVEPRQRHG